MSKEILFGTAGVGEDFAARGYKKTIDAPRYVAEYGLGAYEYQCGRGVRIRPEAAAEFGAVARKAGVTLSLHAPYYISLSSLEVEKRRNSVNYILESARAVDAMGGDRIVVHAGSCAKMPREAAQGLALESMGWALDALRAEGLSHIRVCPETMGKINQFGTLEEVLALCSLDEGMLPCIDFGHLNARTSGSLREKADFLAILDAISNALGSASMREIHAHFSKIEYTVGGGEKRHLTFADTVFGPSFEPMVEALLERDCRPTIICESAGTQAVDAAAMQTYYQQCLGEK